MGKEIVFFVVFGLLWTGIVGVFDGLIGHGIYRAKMAERWPVVTAEILESKVETSRDSDGQTTYKPLIRYRYEVEGRTYTSSRFRFNAFSRGDGGRASSIVKAHPPGRRMQAFYNPDDPGDAVLQRGVQSMDLFLLLFLTPFNVVMIGVWCFVGSRVWLTLRNPEAGGVRIMRRSGAVFARLPRLTPLATAGATALVLSFLSIFVVGVPFGFDPPEAVIAGVWCVVLLASSVVFLWKRYRLGAGRTDLIIDPQSATLSLPQTYGRREDVIVLIDRIEDIFIDVIAHNGNKGGTSETYAPTLIWRDKDGKQQRDRLAEWSHEWRAASFVAWFRREIGLPDESRDMA